MRERLGREREMGSKIESREEKYFPKMEYDKQCILKDLRNFRYDYKTAQQLSTNIF